MGGKARTKALTAKKRSEIAKKAPARWDLLVCFTFNYLGYEQVLKSDSIITNSVTPQMFINHKQTVIIPCNMYPEMENAPPVFVHCPLS